MNDWRKPCEHGRYQWHDFEGWLDCPGGSQVTAADLEGNYELVMRVALHLRGAKRMTWKDTAELAAYQAKAREILRLLIPIRDLLESR